MLASTRLSLLSRNIRQTFKMSTATASKAQSPAPTLSHFLQSARQTLLSSKPSSTSLTLILGNQSADLDSFTSATLYAYFRTLSLPASGPPCIPLLNVPATDIPIRLEHLALMSHAKVDYSTLCTLTDLGDKQTLPDRLPPASTALILTDHNSLEGSLPVVYGECVRGVIDHHEDEHVVPQDTGDYPRVVTPCGSCTTLVVKVIQSVWESAKWEDKAEEARIAKFALASIIVDTRNLGSVDKTTDRDREVAAWLQERIEKVAGAGKGEFQTADFFAEIKAAKNDISAIDSQGVFRKDYKEWEEHGMRIGMSSAVKRLNKLAKKVAKEDAYAKSENPWAQAADDFMRLKGCDLWLVLTSFNDDDDGVHRRELALHWDRKDLKWVAEEFEKTHGEELQLGRSQVEKMDSDWDGHGENGGGRVTWLQKNGAWSRKQVAPAIRKIMREKAPAGTKI